jgi:hypothetical protein
VVGQVLGRGRITILEQCRRCTSNWAVVFALFIAHFNLFQFGLFSSLLSSSQTSSHGEANKGRQIERNIKMIFFLSTRHLSSFSTRKGTPIIRYVFIKNTANLNLPILLIFQTILNFDIMASMSVFAINVSHHHYFFVKPKSNIFWSEVDHSTKDLSY